MLVLLANFFADQKGGRVRNVVKMFIQETRGIGTFFRNIQSVHIIIIIMRKNWGSSRNFVVMGITRRIFGDFRGIKVIPFWVISDTLVVIGIRAEWRIGIADKLSRRFMAIWGMLYLPHFLFGGRLTIEYQVPVLAASASGERGVGSGVVSVSRDTRNRVDVRIIRVVSGQVVHEQSLIVAEEMISSALQLPVGTMSIEACQRFDMFNFEFFMTLSSPHVPVLAPSLHNGFVIE
jgi:hypothetical protein